MYVACFYVLLFNPLPRSVPLTAEWLIQSSSLLKYRTLIVSDDCAFRENFSTSEGNFRATFSVRDVLKEAWSGRVMREGAPREKFSSFLNSALVCTIYVRMSLVCMRHWCVQRDSLISDILENSYRLVSRFTSWKIFASSTS